jgi:hypothetical protein
MECNDIELNGYDQILSRDEWETEVRTIYKRKAKKVLPVNQPLPAGINPGGGVNIGVDGMEDGDSRSQGRVVPSGSRLTPERLAIMRIGNGFLSGAEKQLFVDILYEYEGAVAFDDSEMGLLKPEI